MSCRVDEYVDCDIRFDEGGLKDLSPRITSVPGKVCVRVSQNTFGEIQYCFCKAQINSGIPPKVRFCSDPLFQVWYAEVPHRTFIEK